MKRARLPRPPMCAKCNRPVERVNSWNDPLTARTTFSFWCHGAQELAVLEDELIADADRLRLGRCFEREAVAVLEAGE